MKDEKLFLTKNECLNLYFMFRNVKKIFQKKLNYRPKKGGFKWLGRSGQTCFFFAVEKFLIKTSRMSSFLEPMLESFEEQEDTVPYYLRALYFTICNYCQHSTPNVAKFRIDGYPFTIQQLRIFLPVLSCFVFFF